MQQHAQWQSADFPHVSAKNVKQDQEADERVVQSTDCQRVSATNVKQDQEADERVVQSADW